MESQIIGTLFLLLCPHERRNHCYRGCCPVDTQCPFFEYAGKRIGSINLNLIRLVCAFLMLGFTMLLINGSFIPVGADKATWVWMSLSGLVGFVLGDYFLFASYTMIMARFSQLIMTLAPPFAAIFGFILLGEKMSWISVAGMLVTITGISISILKSRMEPRTAGSSCNFRSKE